MCEPGGSGVGGRGIGRSLGGIRRRSCGVHTTPATACPLTASPITATGTHSSNAEQDYYVFYATQQTVLSLTVNDPEDPACDIILTCASPSATLLHKNGVEISTTQVSTPSDETDVPESITPTIGKGT